MASWLVVWFVVGIVSTLAILACLIGLVRHVLILGRTVKQLQEELQPITDDLAQEGQRAGEHLAAIGDRRRRGSSSGAASQTPG
ncbi:MAG: hypothetical protein ACRDH7_15945 [Actinomycetota bacterium]